MKRTLYSIGLAALLALSACTQHAPAPATQTVSFEARAEQPKAKAAAHRCGALTKKGQPCQNRVKEAGTRCHLHRDHAAVAQ